MRAPPDHLATSTGAPLLPGKQLGRGGEGAVYTIDGASDRVVKLYHRPPTPERAAKLTAMVAGAGPDLAAIATWPLATVHSEVGGPVLGFTMPRYTASRELHELNAPKSRRQHFPQAGWSFLVQVATNAARAFAVVHEHQAVIGDVNDRNLVVSPRATVTLIDCDSFQIQFGDRIFPCGVGVPTHTPPELQGLELSDIVRTPNHDAFGLAVLNFQLLFLGRHPFAGRPLDRDNLTITEAIGEHRFAYSAKAATAHAMAPPPGAPPLSILPPALAEMFERAFSINGAHGTRPAPAEWVTALTALQAGLVTCELGPLHQYAGHLSECPWCTAEAASGIVFFGTARQIPLPSNISLDHLWRRIDAVLPPGNPPQVKGAAAVSPRHRRARSRFTTRGAMTLYLAILLIALAVFTGNFLWIGVPLAGIIFVMSFLESQSDQPTHTSIFRDPYQAHSPPPTSTSAEEGQVSRLLDQWDTLDGRAFAAQRDALHRDLTASQPGSTTQRARRDELTRTATERHLHAFLDSQRIDQAPVARLDPATIAQLQSFGIETADDLRSPIGRVPGLGRDVRAALLTWRHKLEDDYERNHPAQPLTAADKDWIERELAAEQRQRLERLVNGPAQLTRLREQTLRERQVLKRELEIAIQTLEAARGTSYL